ncbi:DUF2189 domain-containing protein [Piscinibacter gummiphilus]|uniref:DUF2189 domain-containing protein n=1 Tax=Piscinibacter gummiphilus TaxID=946333 RepID=A0ABZ0CUR9_9BURK|nr:DUF2189 domain-containing protein [Piscinibacter gummiphilus]WOB08719.1 DUF2189 domain-containing protein [Piscinibacter gummiphilus]
MTTPHSSHDASHDSAHDATRDDSSRPATAFDIPLRPLSWRTLVQCLRLGLRDFKRAPWIGLFYGACFVAMGWALLAVFRHAPVYVLALSAGFLLMGPFLCMGLYRVSQQLEAGGAPHFADSLFAWRTRLGTLAIFGFALLVLEMLWGRAALVVFAVSFDGMPDFKGSLLALLDLDNLGFIVAYLAVGAVFAGLIYAVSVVAIPMILDRQTDAITAALTSLRLVLTQTPVLLVWGAIVTVLVVLALLPGFAGLLVVGPWLGHASWHLYRHAVG